MINEVWFLISKQTGLLAMGSHFERITSLTVDVPTHSFECVMKLFAHTLLNLPSNSLGKASVTPTQYIVIKR